MKNLRKEVLAWIDSHDPEDRDGALSDLLQGGCASGMVSMLIYHSDTIAFYDRHKLAIAALLCGHDCNLGLGWLFGDAWDAGDPLAMSAENQNLLAWYGFESMAEEIALERGVE